MRQPSWDGTTHEPTGSVGLIHPESHFTDEKAGPLRSATYGRLRRHWQFINELVLFEVHHLVTYGVHIYAAEVEPDYLQATSLYHPDTVERSLKHDGSGTEPGLKDDDGKWDLRPHSSRIQRVDLATLGTWHAVLEPDEVPVHQSRMVYTVNRSAAAVLDKLSKARRLRSLGLQFSRGWDESIDRKKGRFDSEWGVPESWDSVILQGPHLHVATPLYKVPNETMSSNKDWTAVDLEALAPDSIPATAYKPRGSSTVYDSAYTHWATADGTRHSARAYYRVAWRRMAANTGERTLIPALVPPGATHVHPVHTFAIPGSPQRDLVLAAGFLSSLLADFCVRAVPKSEILFSTIERMPFAPTSGNAASIILRTLRLTCLTASYAELWEQCFDDSFLMDSWTVPSEDVGAQLGNTGRHWDTTVPLRRGLERRQALVELDAAVALALGISADELISIYRAQFPVMVGYDKTVNIYDAQGRLVPTRLLAAWRQQGDATPASERTWVHPGSGKAYTFQLPFSPRDRAADLRHAYAVLAERPERRLAKTV